MTKALTRTVIAHGLVVVLVHVMVLIRGDVLPQFLDYPVIVGTVIALVAMLVASADAHASITIDRRWLVADETVRYGSLVPGVYAIMTHSTHPTWFVLSALLWLMSCAFLRFVMIPNVRHHDDGDRFMYADQSPTELAQNVERLTLHRRVAVIMAFLGALLLTFVRTGEEATMLEALRPPLGILLSVWLFRNVMVTIRGMFGFSARVLWLTIGVACMAAGPLLYHRTDVGILALLLPLLGIVGLHALAIAGTVEIKRLATMAAAYKEHI